MNIMDVIQEDNLSDQIKFLSKFLDERVFFGEETIKKLNVINETDVIYSDFDIFKHFILNISELYKETTDKTQLFIYLVRYLEEYPELTELAIRDNVFDIIKKEILENDGTYLTNDIYMFIFKNIELFFQTDNGLTKEQNNELYLFVFENILYNDILSQEMNSDFLEILCEFNENFVFNFLKKETIRTNIIKTCYSESWDLDVLPYSTKIVMTKFLYPIIHKDKDFELNNIVLSPVQFESYDLPFYFENKTVSEDITINGVCKESYFLLDRNIEISSNLFGVYAEISNSNSELLMYFFDNNDEIILNENQPLIIKVTQNGYNDFIDGKDFLKSEYSYFLSIPKNTKYAKLILHHIPNNGMDTVLSNVEIRYGYDYNSSSFDSSLIYNDRVKTRITTNEYNYFKDGFSLNNTEGIIQWMLEQESKMISEIDFYKLNQISSELNVVNAMETHSVYPNWDPSENILGNNLQLFYFLLDEEKSAQYLNNQSKTFSIYNDSVIDIINYMKNKESITSINEIFLLEFLFERNNYIYYFLGIDEILNALPLNDERIQKYITEIDSVTFFPDYTSKEVLKEKLFDILYSNSTKYFENYLNMLNYYDNGAELFLDYYSSLLNERFDLVTGKPTTIAAREFQSVYIHYLNNNTRELLDLKGVNSEIVTEALKYKSADYSLNELKYFKTEANRLNFPVKIVEKLENNYKLRDIIAYSLKKPFYYSDNLKIYDSTITKKFESIATIFDNYNLEYIGELKELYGDNQKLQQLMSYYNNENKIYKKVENIKGIVNTESFNNNYFVINELFKKRLEENIYPYKIDLSIKGIKKDISFEAANLMHENSIPFSFKEYFLSNLVFDFIFADNVITNARNITLEFSSLIDTGIEIYLDSNEEPTFSSENETSVFLFQTNNISFKKIRIKFLDIPDNLNSIYFENVSIENYSGETIRPKGFKINDIPFEEYNDVIPSYFENIDLEFNFLFEEKETTQIYYDLSKKFDSVDCVNDERNENLDFLNLTITSNNFVQSFSPITKNFNGKTLLQFFEIFFDYNYEVLHDFVIQSNKLNLLTFPIAKKYYGTSSLDTDWEYDDEYKRHVSLYTYFSEYGVVGKPTTTHVIIVQVVFKNNYQNEINLISSKKGVFTSQKNINYERISPYVTSEKIKGYNFHSMAKNYNKDDVYRTGFFSIYSELEPFEETINIYYCDGVCVYIEPEKTILEKKLYMVTEYFDDYWYRGDTEGAYGTVLSENGIGIFLEQLIVNKLGFWIYNPYENKKKKLLLFTQTPPNYNSSYRSYSWDGPKSLHYSFEAGIYVGVRVN